MFYAVFYAFILVVAGYLLSSLSAKRLTRALAWALVVLTVIVSTSATLHQSPLIRMIVIVTLLLLAMKVVVITEASRQRKRLTFIQWIGFSIGWFGMNPTLFEKIPSESRPFFHPLVKGTSAIIAGLILLYLSESIERNIATRLVFLPHLLLVGGLSLMLHFGVINLSAAVWRTMGVNAPELFRSPYRSKSLKEFWGQRWNIAFSEMTALVAYRPLKKMIGTEKALIISFLLSGLLHEIAISLPVRSGFGLPLLYFVIHAAAMRLEATAPRIQRILHHNVFSRVWVMTLLIAPAPLLFHPNFIQQVLVPLRSMIVGGFPKISP